MTRWDHPTKAKSKPHFLVAAHNGILQTQPMEAWSLLPSIPLFGWTVVTVAAGGRPCYGTIKGVFD